MRRTSLRWHQVPAMVRAPVSALLILLAAVYPTSWLLQMNLQALPALPWALIPGGLYLWLLWRYIGGWGAPAATSAIRARNRRCHRLAGPAQVWIWLSSAALAVTLFSYSMIKLLTETGGVQQTALLEAVAPLPATSVLPWLAMLVIMTAFFEEAAFRGYMQTQLEQRYRPAVAVFLTALLFAAVHFPALEQLPLFVFGSIGWGVLTYLSRSIIPAIVMHGVIDGVLFVWAWLNPERFQTLLAQNVLVTGPSELFVTSVMVAVAGTALTICAFYRLSRVSEP